MIGFRTMDEFLDKPLRDMTAYLAKYISKNTKYAGVKALKNPMDFWSYQEIIWETKPDVIVEIGIMHGGSTLALAHLCDVFGHGEVIGIDLDIHGVPDRVRDHPRITLIKGDAVAVYPQVRDKAAGKKVLVIEDSSHEYENTLKVLETYCDLVNVGSYFIVEDCICGHGYDAGPSPGPQEAAKEFISKHPEFEIDRKREHCITFNPKGFLKKVRN